jgi:hypothetical protein
VVGDGGAVIKKLFMFLGLAAALVSFSAVSKVSADASTWQKSVNIQPQSPTDFASTSFDTSVNNAISDGANYITLVIPVSQSNVYSTSITAGGQTPTDASLTSAVNYIHSKGASVGFVLHDDVADGSWRAYINPSDRSAWFASYGAQLNHYASLGQALGVQELIIGSELSDMTLPSVNSSNTSNWISLIQQVRNEYKGTVTYASQHDGYMADDESLGFWPELDAIGIDAYYSLGGGGDESVATIENNWNQYEAEIQNLSTKYNKPVLFTEVGYVSQTNALVDPGSAYGQGASVDDSLQANAYQALFSYWQNYSFMHGVNLWDWSSNPNAGGTNDNDYTPQNKPAEQVMKQFFTTNSGTPSAPINVTYSTSSSAGSSPTPNTATSITTQVKASSSASNMIVDVEIYNASGQQVSQTYYSGQNLSTTASTYTSSFTPTATGAYTIEVGVFTANWQSNALWNASSGSFAVATPVTTPPPVVTPPPVTTPSPPAAPPSSPTPPTSTPSFPTSIDVWWPSNGTSVSGVQPFQATLDGIDPSTYNMYWQVDNGTLNSMSTNTSPVAHKEADVDLSSWNWSSTRQYTITFVAKTLSGQVIATQNETITVTH